MTSRSRRARCRGPALAAGRPPRRAAARRRRGRDHRHPLDREVYLDLGVFRDLALRFEAPGDFAQAYVVAHEVGHHVQLTGIAEQVDAASRENPDARNALSVRMELQADCLAGVWAHSTYERASWFKRGFDDGDASACDTFSGDI